MKDIFSGQNIQRAFQNPLTMAGLAVMQGAPMGEALMKASESNRQHQYAQLHQAQFQAEQQKQAHAKLFAQNLSEKVKDLGATDINDAIAKLLQIPGAESQKFGDIMSIAKGLTGEKEDGDFFTGPGRLRYMTRRNPETGEVEAVPIPGQQSVEGGSDATGILKPKDAIRIETNLRKEVTQQSKKWDEVQHAYDRINSAAQDKTGAGDITLLTSYMKMIDPTTGVKEGEFATAANAGSIPEKVRAQYNKAINGQLLSDVTRQQFVDEATKLYRKAEKRQRSIVDNYRDISERYNVNPNNVVQSFIEEYTPETNKKVEPAQSAPREFKGENGHVYSQEEIDAALRGE